MFNEEDQPTAMPAWFVTFADMMTLLLCFFITLFTLGHATPDGRFEAISDSLRDQFGSSDSKRTLPPGDKLTSDISGSRYSAQQSEAQRLTMIRPGPISTINAALFFDEAGADLTDQHRLLLEQAAVELRGKTQKIEIRGHALARPAADQSQPDDWHLAFDRAHKVMEYLASRDGIDRKRFRLGVSGPNDPLYPEPELNHRNSRVEVFMLGEFTDKQGGEEAVGKLPHQTTTR